MFKKSASSNAVKNHHIRSTKDFYTKHPVADILYNYSKLTVSSNTTDMSEENDLLLIKYKKTDEGNEKMSNKTIGSKRSEVYSLFLFIIFFLFVIIILSQILVMHNKNQSTNFLQIKTMQDDLKLMDKTIDTMLREKLVIPMQVWYVNDL